jgi:SNF family Na+-dependent transporter
MLNGARERLGIFTVCIVLSLVSIPTIAEACAVCTAGRDEENALAFLLSTIGMSLMPLVALGTLVFVLWRRIQKLEAEGRTAAAAKTPIESPATPIRS